MAIERKDVRAKLDEEWHRALAVVSDADHQDIGEWVEELIVRELKRRIHDAHAIAAATQHLGKTGRNRE
jgi:hypothetical protein